jgi:hypothetical protein
MSPWHGRLSEFIQALGDARDGQKAERDAYMNDPGKHPDPGHLNRATYLVDELEAILARLLDSASFLRLQQSFRVARIIIVAWLVLATSGVLAFVYAVRTGPTAVDVPASPVTASLRVPADDRAHLAKQLGKSCPYDPDAVPVIVLSADDKTAKAQIVTVPTEQCTPVRLEVTSDRITGPPPRLGG